jgi:hypothetical protein
MLNVARAAALRRLLVPVSKLEAEIDAVSFSKRIRVVWAVLEVVDEIVSGRWFALCEKEQVVAHGGPFKLTSATSPSLESENNHKGTTDTKIRDNGTAGWFASQIQETAPPAGSRLAGSAFSHYA